MPDARGIYGHPDPNTQYPNVGDFTPYLIEEFNAPIDLDADPIWTWSDTSLGDGNARMVKDNITFENGSMVLKVTETPQPGGYSFAAADNVADRPLSSGEFRTIYNNFRYGRYEVRMKAPPKASNYIFTMFAYRTPAYLNWREIDIEVQASPQNSFITNLITAEPGTRTWNGGIEESARTYPFGGDPALNVYPIAGQYDWFRFYKWNQETTYPCANTPSCLPEEDLKLAKNNPNDGLPDIRPELCTSATGKLDVACGP
jgi:hypothetical protein